MFRQPSVGRSEVVKGGKYRRYTKAELLKQLTPVQRKRLREVLRRKNRLDQPQKPRLEDEVS